LDNYKKKAGKNNGKLLIDLTRQEIANFTGLCVETVIRTLSKMKSQNKVSIIDKKLYY
jgi:CRP/FNR family transcriptional regulator